MTPEDELNLVEMARGGDEAAFESLVIEHQKLIYNVALKLTGSPDDALDISQDTFIKAYRNLNSFRGESRLSAWLYRLCYNASMDFIRRNRNSNVVSMTSDDGSDMQIDIPDPSPQPEELAEKRDTVAAVRSAVMELPEAHRQVIVMREFSGMSYTAIADALSIEEGTVKSRLSRARLALAEILKKHGTFPPGMPSSNKKGGLRHDKL